MTAYYNENEPYCVAWLRNLIDAGLIAQGVVDDRSIREVTRRDLAGFTQCHFFAGLGGWSLALRLAGWPDSREVWTGSCPCQPFSAAGKQQGMADERHLWPVWFDLIRECAPAVVFGEQVEAAVRHRWLDGVFSDLEAENYACGASVLGAHSVGAPHIRQRLWWVADDRSPGWQVAGDGEHRAEATRAGQANQPGRGSEASRLADSSSAGLEERQAHGQRADTQPEPVAHRDGLQHAAGDGRQQWRSEPGQWGTEFRRGADGKLRRVEPGIQPLAHGVSNRVGRLRAYGNAIVPEVAAAFIAAYLES